jgi:inner membrane protease subunit 1
MLHVPHWYVVASNSSLSLKLTKQMNGASMLPTFSGDPSEIVVEEMLTHTLFPNNFLNRGNLITLESPISRGRLVCKRLIGMPGDIVCLDPTGQYADPSEHIIVPKGHVWVCGDNLTASRDSRVYGPVPMALVKGKIVARASVTGPDGMNLDSDFCFFGL